MFTGIIEGLGKIVEIRPENGNLQLSLGCDFVSELKIDQSLAHNGVCLTVVNITDSAYTVTAIAETLQKTNLGTLKVGDIVNLERCLQFNDRLDGHLVQGHVDQTAICTQREDANGSTLFSFEYEPKGNTTVEKGSICVNGISLTVVNSTQNGFSVAIIPYTMEHTNLQNVQVGNVVNLEFDILGKYIAKLMQINS